MRYTRADWRARRPRQVNRLPWVEIDTLYVHYTAMDADRTGDPRARARAIQNFHMGTRGWLDIAYTHGFTDEGDILELRGWQVYTAATGIENDHSQALVFFGGDREGRDDVTPRGRQALQELVAEAFRLKGRRMFVKGHTDARDPAGLTACPGPELMSFIALQNRYGWRFAEPRPRYPRHFFLFAAWRLGEGAFRQYGKAHLAVRPKQLPRRGSPQLAAYWVALGHFLRQRKGLHA